ncbi:uncharacterized protein LOC113352462 [Papaver somniferum]|uniref:uncharacterized protein LOC113352462 n=1 Tax=Papaver somniferum TaxID=3469 RepID=UPI000E6F7EA1|nr:uncharacterized protein LOC113352462 [Papaver somniferum]
MTMLLIDFTNAFNIVSRTVLINEVREKWVQQGDPLGPLLFSLVFHPLICKIALQCKLDLNSWYLDDGTLVGETTEVARDLQILREEGPARGLQLNIQKTEIFSPHPDPRCQIVFPSEIGRPDTGVRLLGGPVSLSDDFCSRIIQSRVDKTVHRMNCVKKLRDPQAELMLLRNCAGVSKLYFSMHTTRPQCMKTTQLQFDEQLIQFLQYLITSDGAWFGQLKQRIATLPISYGGLGVYTMHDTTQYGYLASCFQTQHLQNRILQGTPGLSPHFQTALEYYIHICGLSPSSFNINDGAPHPMHLLATRYYDAIMKEDSICSCCKRVTDRFGDHTIHCASEVGLKYLHDLVRDLFVELCYKAGVAARKEASLGLTSDRSTPLKPADLMIYNWENGRVICFDVTGVSPFSKGGNRTFTLGHAISVVITRKRNKYADMCSSHGYGFGVLAFTTLGELSDDITVLLKRLKNCMANHDANNNLGSFLFHRLGIIIQKGIGVQLVARLPTKSL